MFPFVNCGVIDHHKQKAGAKRRRMQAVDLIKRRPARPKSSHSIVDSITLEKLNDTGYGSLKSMASDPELGLTPLDPDPLPPQKTTRRASDSGIWSGSRRGEPVVRDTGNKGVRMKPKNSGCMGTSGAAVVFNNTYALERFTFKNKILHPFVEHYKTDPFRFSFVNEPLVDKEEENLADFFNALPDEMVLKVIRWLPKRCLSTLCRVSKRFNRLAIDETLWKRLDLQGRTLFRNHLQIVLERRPVYLRLAQAGIADPAFSSTVDNVEKFSDQLLYLDLGMATISVSALTFTLTGCTNLVKLSLEHVEVDCAVLKTLAMCVKLEILNMTTCSGVNFEAFAQVMRALQSLKHLNMGCMRSDKAITFDEMMAVVSVMSPSLEKLNIAGYREILVDPHVEVLTTRFKNLIDLDISDSPELTLKSIQHITTNLTKLQRLGISRCYNINPGCYSMLGDLKHLKNLEIFSLFKDSSLKSLKVSLKNISINGKPFSEIGRPTVGLKRSSIWGERVRD